MSSSCRGKLLSCLAFNPALVASLGKRRRRTGRHSWQGLSNSTMLVAACPGIIFPSRELDTQGETSFLFHDLRSILRCCIGTKSFFRLRPKWRIFELFLESWKVTVCYKSFMLRLPNSTYLTYPRNRKRVLLENYFFLFFFSIKILNFKTLNSQWSWRKLYLLKTFSILFFDNSNHILISSGFGSFFFPNEQTRTNSRGSRLSQKQSSFGVFVETFEFRLVTRSTFSVRFRRWGSFRTRVRRVTSFNRSHPRGLVAILSGDILSKGREVEFNDGQAEKVS